MPTGVKHLVKCKCVLPQFRKQHTPPQHQFIVFSVINDEDRVNLKFAQCPNCGVVHKVIEISRSEIMQNREAMSSIVSIDDIRSSLPQQLTAMLDANKVDLATWEHTQFIYENKQWGSYVVLASDTEAGIKSGKYVRILGEALFKVESFTKEVL